MMSIKTYSSFLNYCIANSLKDYVTPEINYDGNLSISYLSSLEISCRLGISLEQPEKGVVLVYKMQDGVKVKSAMAFSSGNYKDRIAYGVVSVISKLK